MKFNEQHENTQYNETEINSAILYVGNSDYSVLKNKKSIDNLMEDFKKFREGLRTKAKEKEPSTIQQFKSSCWS